MTKRAADLGWLFESDETREPPSRRRTARLPTSKPPLPLYRASIKELAEAGTIRVNSSINDVDNSIIQRIRKCLDRANHPNTADAEAKAAFHLASRLMGQYNVSQAEVLAHESPTTQMRYAGQSVVSIHHVDRESLKPVRHQGYVDALCEAMEDFFDCKYYSAATPSSLDLTFYGIAENTVAASMSFEMAYNLIAQWASSYKGIGTRNSYCLGASDELSRLAQKEKAAEEAEARKAETDLAATRLMQEEAERLAQLDRLAPLPRSPDELRSLELATHTNPSTVSNGCAASDGAVSSSQQASREDNDQHNSIGIDPSEEDYESSEDGIEPDFKVEDENLSNCLDELADLLVKVPKAEPASETSYGLYSASPPAPRTDPVLKLEPESKWASHMQLVTFRATATKIADEYLRESGVKLRRGRASRLVIRDPDAYSHGVKDGKKIDVHRKRIEE